MNNLVSTAEAQNGFYPTPKSVAYQLFDMIDTQPIREVLEPSAGKGDLLKAFGCYKNEKYQELIIAVKPCLEGEMTALYINNVLKDLGINITRLASGIPMGADMEYIDPITLEKAFDNRKKIS